MLQNYFKIAVRNLLKHTGYSFINISGLALGIACCLVILLYVQDELSYDRYHEHADRIYRVAQEQRFGGTVQQVAVVAAPVAPALARDFPEVEAAVRLRRRAQLVSWGEKKFFGEQIVYADSNFFSFFTLPLLRGDPETVLATPGSLVLTENMARKYFGDEDPVGKILKLDNRYDGTVTGVMQNVPRNSHFHGDAVAAFSVFHNEPWINNWGVNLLWAYVRLQPGTAPQACNEKLPAFVEKYRGKETLANISYYLQPLTAIHLRSHFIAEIEPNSDIAYVYIFSAIAAFVLLIACINYMNLATARSAKRMKEVGMRKVLGADRLQIIKQFLAESVLISFLAVWCAIFLIEIMLPTFRDFSGKTLSANYLANPLLIALLLAITLVVGIVAGTYPAFFLSTFQPATVLKGSLKSGSKAAGFRKTLVVAQFAISIVLIVGTAAVHRQLDFVKSKHLGFNKEHVLTIKTHDRSLRGKTEMIKAELFQHAQIASAAATSDPLVNFLSQSGVHPDSATAEESWLMSSLCIDPDFIATMEMQILAGRGFSATMASDSTAGFVINEAAVKEMGLRSPEAALGKRLVHRERSGPVLGVVRNFHFTSLHRKIEPLIMMYDPGELLPITVRVRPENLAATLSFLEQTWNRLSPAWPFDFAFFDQDLDALYRADEKVGQVFGVFAMIAIAIACLGLFGLSSYTTEQRTKEIGVRKVLGASVAGIIALLSKEFVKLVLVANLIAWPVAYVAMSKWLEDFAYRADLGIATFLLATAAALLIAFVTVSFQAIKAAVANPVEALRYE